MEEVGTDSSKETSDLYMVSFSPCSVCGWVDGWIRFLINIICLVPESTTLRYEMLHQISEGYRTIR